MTRLFKFSIWIAYAATTSYVALEFMASGETWTGVAIAVASVMWGLIVESVIGLVERA